MHYLSTIISTGSVTSFAAFVFFAALYLYGAAKRFYMTAGVGGSGILLAASFFIVFAVNGNNAFHNDWHPILNTVAKRPFDASCTTNGKLQKTDVLNCYKEGDYVVWSNASDPTYRINRDGIGQLMLAFNPHDLLIEGKNPIEFHSAEFTADIARYVFLD